MIARGAGRSYGDAAQNVGGTVLDLRAMDRAPRIDAKAMTVTVQPGVTYAGLLSELGQRGFILPVIPGTRHVTMGGAIASDVHGKNHPRDGSISRLVASLTLCTPADGLRVLDAQRDRELVLASLGAMGLLGVVVEATLAIEPLRAPWFAIDTDRTDSLEETLALMARDEGHRYSVAWLDMLAGGSRLGRAVVTRSHDAPAGPAPSTAARPLGPFITPAHPHPARLSGRCARFAADRRVQRASLARVPARASERGPSPSPRTSSRSTASATGTACTARAASSSTSSRSPTDRRPRSRAPPSCCARVASPPTSECSSASGAASGGPLSFPSPGWTLALDIPTWAPGLWPTLDALDEIVAGAGGRVYLTKDLRLRRDAFEAMYPQLPRFHELRALVDPDGVLRSDLGARLGLCRTAA